MRAVLLTVLAVLMFVVPNGYADDEKLITQQEVIAVAQKLNSSGFKRLFDKYRDKPISWRCQLAGISKGLFSDSVTLVFQCGSKLGAVCIAPKSIMAAAEIGKEYTMNGRIYLLTPEIVDKKSGKSMVVVTVTQTTLPELGSAGKYGPLTVEIINTELGKLKDKSLMEIYSRHVGDRRIKWNGEFEEVFDPIGTKWRTGIISVKGGAFKIRTDIPTSQMAAFKQRTRHCGRIRGFWSFDKIPLLAVEIYDESTDKLICKPEDN